MLRSTFVQYFALLRVFYTLLVYVKHRITHATLPTVKYHSRIVTNELFLISNATVIVSNETVKFIATLHTGKCTRLDTEQLSRFYVLYHTAFDDTDVAHILW